MLWTVIFYFSVLLASVKVQRTNIPFNILLLSPASLWWSCLFREENCIIQEESWMVQLLVSDHGGNTSFQWGETLQFPLCHCLLSQSTCGISYHLFLSFPSQDLRLLARIDWFWAGMSYSSACLGVWSCFFMVICSKSCFFINGGHCP